MSNGQCLRSCSLLLQLKHVFVFSNTAVCSNLVRAYGGFLRTLEVRVVDFRTVFTCCSVIVRKQPNVKSTYRECRLNIWDTVDNFYISGSIFNECF